MVAGDVAPGDRTYPPPPPPPAVVIPTRPVLAAGSDVHSALLESTLGSRDRRARNPESVGRLTVRP